MTGKSTLGQHLVAAKFASLKGFLISSDEDDYSDEELDTSAHQKQKHFWLDDDDDEEGEEEEEDEEREELGKAVKAYAVSKRSSSGRKRLRNQHRRRPEQSSSPLPSPPRQIRSSKSKAKDPHKKVPSRELTISSDGEEEAFNINTEGEDEGEEQTKKANKCQKSPVRQDSKVIRSKYIRSADDQQMTTRPTTRKAEAARSTRIFD